MQKKKIRQYSAYDLLEIVIKAVETDVTAPAKFKSYFDVDFSFIQACSALNRKKIFGKPVINCDEYGILKELTDKEYCLSLLKRIKTRNTKTIYDLDDAF